MSDEPHDNLADEEALARAGSRVLQDRLWTVVNDPQAGWAREPHLVAHASAELLAGVLSALALTDESDLAFGLHVLEDVRQAVLRRTPLASAAPPTRAH